MSISDNARRLVLRAGEYDSEYDRARFRGLTNHLPMTLLALGALGAEDARLEHEFARQSAWLRPFPGSPNAAPIDANNWKTQLGRAGTEGAYLAFLRAEHARLGTDALLRAYLPALVPGLGTGAFHPMIRTAYGVRFGVDEEVVRGLAYWCATCRDLGAIEGTPLSDDPVNVLALLAKDRTLARAARGMGGFFGKILNALRGQSISGLMEKLAAMPAFAAAGASLLVGDDTLPRIAEAACRLYGASGSFTALHGVTGTHAFRVLLPYMGDRARATQHLWQALVAAWVTTGMPGADFAAKDAPGWDRIAAAAREPRDEHDIKLADSCREEAAAYPQRDALYRAAAAVRLGLA